MFSRECIIESAICCVAEHGLEGTRTQMITKKAGVSEAMLFKHFGSKDELLRCCFELVDREIAALFAGMSFTPEQLERDPRAAVWLMWEKYFSWLVSHRDKTLFYFAYRMAPAFPKYEWTRDAAYFADFVSIVTAFDEKFHLYSRFPIRVLWTQILSVTQLYAKSVIQGALPADEGTTQAIFSAVMGTICSALGDGS